MIGQNKNKELLMQWRLNRSVPRFIIIEGDEGSGRLELAKVIMKIINATGIIAGNGIADVREIIENAYTVTDTTCYIFRNADDMKNEAKNALLKVVEEPPNNAYFIMTVHNIDNMLGTIKSRGTVIRMEPYSKLELESYCHDDLLLNYCNNIGQLQIDRKDVEVAEKCVNDVLKALREKSGTRLLKSCTQLKCKKTETNKIDCLLFMRIFEKTLYHNMCNDYIFTESAAQSISECKNELCRTTINNKSSIETMLVKLLEDVKCN